MQHDRRRRAQEACPTATAVTPAASGTAAKVTPDCPTAPGWWLHEPDSDEHAVDLGCNKLRDWPYRRALSKPGDCTRVALLALHLLFRAV
jgi:hypothetical protein